MLTIAVRAGKKRSCHPCLGNGIGHVVVEVVVTTIWNPTTEMDKYVTTAQPENGNEKRGSLDIFRQSVMLNMAM